MVVSSIIERLVRMRREPGALMRQSSVLRMQTCCAVLAMCGTFSTGTRDVFGADPESEAPGKQTEPLARWQSDGLPLMQAYCIDCHNEDVQEGGLDLTPFETLSDLSTPEVKRVLSMVQFGAMPPEDYDLPEIEERKQLVSALEQTMYSSTCDLRPRAGKVTVRRLNRNEYNHSIRDLFGLDLRPADQFPSDEVGAGFDNNGDVLSLSPMLIEKYIDAAEFVSRRVVIDPAELPNVDLDIPGDQLPIYGEPQIGRFGGRFVDRETFAWLDVEVPFDGEYRVGVKGGATGKNSDPIHVGIYDEDGSLLAHHDLKYFGGGGRSERIKVSVKLDKGKHRLAFVPHFGEEELVVGQSTFGGIKTMDPERVKRIRETLGKLNEPAKKIDEDEHPFMFRSIELSGPRDVPSSAYPPMQWQLLRHKAPKKRNQYYDVEPTALKNLRTFMPEIFRGPVDDEVIRPYAQLVKEATDRGESYYRGTQIALAAMLVSPQFIFRVETPTEDTKPNEFGDYPLSQHQLATRLSYFLWSSTPDQVLLDKADRNELSPEQLRRQVERMLKDPKANAMASEFAAQWLGLRNLSGHEADRKQYPQFTDELKRAMSSETELLFMHVLRNNLSVSEFLTADYSFVGPTLAQHYGIDFKGTETRKVSLAQSPRRGLLSHASILTLTSTPTRTSPVLRGKWILENVLGTTPPDPPPGVPELEESEGADEHATLREQLELHRQSPTCASCHRVMDQLGFGLDDFDAIGQYRTEDGGKPIDASGMLPDGRSFEGGVELSEMLGETETEALALTIIQRLMTFAIGRELGPDDRCTLDEIAAKTKANQYRLADIVVAVVGSRQFQFQTDQSQNEPDQPATDQ